MAWVTRFEPLVIAGHGKTTVTRAKRIWLGEHGPVVFREERANRATRALELLDATLAREVTTLGKNARRTVTQC